MGKNVAVFVDVANIFYAAKAAGVDIDYVTLLKSATAGRDLVRAYAYTGLDPDNENQRNFHDFLRRSNYKVVSKDIRKYGDGKVKANLDIELVVDMMKTARNLDIAIVVSGDGDFAPAIRAVQEQGVRVEVISFRGNTSSDLIEAADQFTDIVQLARVEKGSRSGRRVAEDGDLSMTEVPDKLTEGTGIGRGGRGRGRGRVREEEPAAARARGRGRAASAPTIVGGVAGGGAGMVSLPGERFARDGGSLTEADLAAAEVFTLDDPSDEGTSPPEAAEPMAGTAEEAEPRRRRRRGGRGRGRGRGREDGQEAQADEAQADEAQADEAQADAAQADEAAAPVRPSRAPSRKIAHEDDDIVPARRAPQPTPFGSVWDSQLGTPPAPAPASRAPIADDDDLDEPEIPEYLIAEQRRGAGHGARGGRSAYQSAMERERFGRGAGAGGSRSGGHGINRYPDVSARTSPTGPRREERSYGRQERTPAPPRPRGSSEPWSDVPPELEAMLRAQVAQKPVPVVTPRLAEDRPAIIEPTSEVAPRARVTRKPSTRTAGATSSIAPEGVVQALLADQADSANGAAAAESGIAAESAPKRRVTRAPKTAVVDGREAADSAEATPAPSPKPRAARKPAAARAAGTAVAPAPDADGPTAAPKRRAARKTATSESA